MKILSGKNFIIIALFFIALSNALLGLFSYTKKVENGTKYIDDVIVENHVIKKHESDKSDIENINTESIIKNNKINASENSIRQYELEKEKKNDFNSSELIAMISFYVITGLITIIALLFINQKI